MFLLNIVLQYVQERSRSWKYNPYFPVAVGAGKIIYTQMIAYLSRPQPNMSLIGEGCDSLGNPSLMSLVGNH